MKHRVLAITALALALRAAAFSGRGSYVTFDEGWYLLLARNLFDGAGYTLTGLPHVTLSPLFPILAGLTHALGIDIVTAGRVVALVASTLLVLPVWMIARHLHGPRTADIAALLVAVTPALAPFTVPFWIGWELWAGAEPLLHLFAYTSIALTLVALRTRSTVAAATAGISAALAYLARPEGLLVFALLGIVTLIVILHRRRLRVHLPGLILACVLFIATAAPYWLYLRHTTGQWTLTGRDVAAAGGVTAPGTEPLAAGRVVDAMLWTDTDRSYVRNLYALDASGLRLADPYWGVQPPPASATVPAPPTSTTTAPTAAATPASTTDTPSAVVLYFRALGTVAPWFLWLFAVIGAIVPRRRRTARAVAALPVVGTSVVVAALVAADPRTQLIILPLACIWAAAGVRSTARAVAARGSAALVRRHFPLYATAAILALLLAGTTARRVWLSHSLGSPHHLVGAANRAVGIELARRLAPDEAVMSWHPALALYADRDWRVLPLAPLPDIVRYAAAIGTPHVLLSAYYPSPLALDGLDRQYLLLRAPDTNGASGWSLRLTGGSGPLATATLHPITP